MSGMIESALVIMSGSERRIASIANNVANVATPGFKRQLSFTEAMNVRSSESSATRDVLLRTRSDLAQGRMIETGNPLDIAIGGDGFFRLRAGEDVVYSRQGQFRRTDDGTVVNAQGHVLQQAEGGDLVLDRDEVEILGDGTIVAGESPVARIALSAPGEDRAVEALGGSTFRIEGEAVEVDSPSLRQGMLESSNVSLSDEMAAMMIALRHAETGARLVTLYDELLGRAITSFGQAGR